MSSSLDTAKSHLKEHGWVRIPSVLSEGEISSALARLWKAKADVEGRGGSTHLSFLDPNSSNVRLFFLLSVDKIFRDLAAHPKAVEMVQFALGESFLISNFSANIARPGSQHMALHSDQSLVIPGPWHEPWAVNVTYCLTDATKENGATLYVPGSHKWTSRAQVPKNCPELLVPLEGKAGDIFIVDGRLWHTSGKNATTNEDRALLFGYYTKPFIRQEVNWTAKLDKEIQDALSEEMKNWLGLNVVANVDVIGDWRYMSEQYPDYAVPGSTPVAPHSGYTASLSSLGYGP